MHVRRLVTLSCHFEVGVVTKARVGVLIASSPRSRLDKQAPETDSSEARTLNPVVLT